MAVPKGSRLAPIEQRLLDEMALQHRDVPGVYAVRFFGPITGTAVVAVCYREKALYSYETPARNAIEAEKIQRGYLAEVLRITDLTSLEHDAGIAAASVIQQLRAERSSEPRQ